MNKLITHKCITINTSQPCLVKEHVKKKIVEMNIQCKIYPDCDLLAISS